MAYEFRKLSEVEKLGKATDDTNILVEKDGVIKRVAKNEVGKTEVKELMYEWNFSVEDEVYEILENVDDDLSWVNDENSDIAIVVTAYGISGQDQDTEMFIFDKNMEVSVSSFKTSMGYGYTKNINLMGNLVDTCCISICYNGDDFSEYPNFIDLYCNICLGVNNNNDELVKVDKGAFIVIHNDSPSPLKSIRIYKVTHQ